MKKWLIGIAAVVVLLVVVLLVIPFLIPTGAYVDRVVALTKQATGRDLTIKGKISFSLLPRVALEASDVSFSNAPGMSTPDMATIGKLQIEVRPLALLSGDLVIDRFVIVDPHIALEVDKAGRPNWQFAQPAGSATGAPAAAAQPTSATGAKPAASSSAAFEQLHLGDVRLVNGAVTYLDARTGKKVAIDKINAKLALPDLASPMQVDSGATWNGQTVALVLDLGSPQKFLAGQKTPVSLKLAATPIAFGFKGEVAAAAALTLDGETQLEIPSLRELVSWTGGALPVTSGGLGPFKVDGKLAFAGNKASFSGAKIVLDQMNATGDLAVDTAAATPYLKGSLDIDKLDLNPYLPPTAPAAAGKPGAPGGVAGANPARPAPPPAATAAGWSDEPIDLAALKTVNADFALAVGGVAFKKIVIGKSALTLQLKDGRLAAELGQMALYDGSGKGSIHLDGTAPAMGLVAAFDLSGVQSEPLLRDAMSFDRVKGAMTGNLTLEAKGKSERELISALDGKGALSFANGAIRGIDIGGLIGNIQNALTSANSQKDQQTAFTEMDGTFTITNGIAKNTDLQLKSALLQVAGAGTIDLPRRTVDYRIEPKIAGNAPGGGITVPVAVQGPWDNVTYHPQFDQLLRNPKALDALKGALGGGDNDAAAPSSGGGSSKPADVLRGLFGGKK
jgi:AsmA protein